MSDSDGEGAHGVDNSGLKKDFTYKLKAFKRRALHSITKVFSFHFPHNLPDPRGGPNPARMLLH